MSDEFNGAGRKRDGIEVVVDVMACGLGLNEVMRMVEEYRAANPDRDVWLDGDMRTIVSQMKVSV